MDERNFLWFLFHDDFFGMISYCTHQEYYKLSIISNVIVLVFSMFGQKENIAKYLGSSLKSDL